MQTVDLNLHGVMSAPVVPFGTDTSIDLAGYRTIVTRLIEEGVTALFPCGSIGELPHLDAEEWRSIVVATVDMAERRIPVVATVGHPDLRRLGEQIAWAAAAGVDALLVVPPYYFKLDEDEWLSAMRFVDGHGVPFIVYNNPSLGGMRTTLSALERLIGMARFAGLKEATADPEDYRAKAALLDGRAPIIAAAETPLLQMLSIKADACLTAIASIAPAPLHALWQAVSAGDLVSARAVFARISAFRAIVAAESAGGRPGYISVAKAALTLRGLPGGVPRPPLRPMAEVRLPALRAVMEQDLGITCTAPAPAAPAPEAS
jgi:dihydrodipicolinate synthase/N-acetylneuraminate lyase